MNELQVTLQRAAELIIEHGHRNSHDLHDNGKLSINGALKKALGYESTVSILRLDATDRQIVNSAMQVLYNIAPDHLPNYLDKSTDQEIVALLDKAIEQSKTVW